jgi:metal-dependent HD superfamily phosphatase/phosphodiesterase
MSEGPRTPSEAVAAMDVHAPSERNRKLAAFIAAANGDTQLKARWLAQQTTAERLGMSDHSWVHLQIVLNMALRLFRMLRKHGVQSAIERDHAMNSSDAEVIIAGGCLLHDLGMSIHRVDHEAFSLFLAADALDRLLDGIYEEPERTIVASEIMHAIIGHRSAGRPLTIEAGIVRVADALDMEHGRSRASLETHLPNIHSLSAAAIDEVRVVDGETRPIRIEVEMNNTAGVFQVDELLATKLRGSGLEEHIEVVARIEAEHEKRLLRVYRI